MSRLALLVMVVACALPLYADIEGTIAGEVHGSKGAESGAKVVIEVDPRWGYQEDEHFEKFREWNKDLPEVSGSAETTTDASGKYEIKLKVKVSDNTKLPKINFHEGRRLVEKQYCVARITITQDGYRPSTIYARVADGAYCENSRGGRMSTSLYPKRTVTATLVRQDGKSAAGIRIVGDSSGGRQPSLGFEVVADTKGRIEIEDNVLSDQLMLSVATEGLAFPHDANTWRLSLKGGENALGNLTVVPGGQIKFRALRGDTGKPASVQCALRARVQQSRVGYDVMNDENGERQLLGLPVGDYTLSLNPRFEQGLPHLWYAYFEVKIEAGTVLDLGDVTLEPQQSLDVFAIDENGTTIETYNVQMELVPGSSAPFIRPRYNDKGIYVGASCTAEKTKVERLVRGTWQVTVHAEGYSPGTAEVKIPTDEPLTVTLVQGGGIEFQSDRGERVEWQQVWAVLTTAPCYQEVSRMPAVEVRQAFDDGLDPTGVYPPPSEKRDRFASDRGTLKPIPEGTYTVFLSRSYGDLRRFDNVSVRKGETTVVVVSDDAPAEVRVVATEQGVPKGSVSLVAIPLSGNDRSKSVTAKTDGSGVAVLRALPPGPYLVVTKEEFDWLSSQTTHFGHAAGVGLLGSDNKFQVSPGDRFEYSIELYDPGRIWLTVKVKGLTIANASILELFHGDYPTGERTVKGVNGTFEFGPVRAGTYEFFDGGFGDRHTYYTRFEVNEAPRQTIELDVKLSKVSVTLRIPKVFENSEFHTYLTPYYDEPSQVIQSVSVGNRTKSARDKVEFADVPEGRYILTSWAETWQPERATTSHYELIEVSKNTKVTVKFDDDTAPLSLKLSGETDLLRDSILDRGKRCLWLEVLDRKGERVMINGSPTSLVYNDAMRGYRVEPGKYTVRLFGRGFETLTFEDVDIKKGLGAMLEVQIKPAATVRVQVPNIAPNALLCEQVTIEAFDSDGNALSTDSGGAKAIFQPRATRFPVKDERGWNRDEDRRPVCELKFMNIPAASARLRVKAPGYKAVEFEVTPDIKRATEYTVKFEKE